MTPRLSRERWSETRVLWYTAGSWVYWWLRAGGGEGEATAAVCVTAASNGEWLAAAVVRAVVVGDARGDVKGNVGRRVVLGGGGAGIW